MWRVETNINTKCLGLRDDFIGLSSAQFPSCSAKFPKPVHKTTGPSSPKLAEY